MSQTLLAALGIAAAVVNTAGLVPYMRDVFRHKTQPQRATWWVFFGLVFFALIAQIQAGATWSLLFTVGNILAIGLIAVSSLKYGYGSFRCRDALALVIAAAGIAIAQFIKSPLFALAVIIAVDVTGFGLTVAKAWIAPQTETLVAWVLATIGAGLAIVAVGKPDVSQLIYPAYIFLGNGLLSMVIVLRRPKVLEVAKAGDLLH